MVAGAGVVLGNLAAFYQEVPDNGTAQNRGHPSGAISF